MWNTPSFLAWVEGGWCHSLRQVITAEKGGVLGGAEGGVITQEKVNMPLPRVHSGILHYLPLDGRTIFFFLA